VPALKTNSEGLKKVLEDLVKQYNTKQLEMEKWKVCHPSGWQAEGGKQLTRCSTEEEQYPGCPAVTGLHQRGVRDGDGWHKFTSHSHRCSLKESFLPCPGDSHGDTRIYPKLAYQLGRSGSTKNFCLIARLCTTSLAAYTIQRAGIDVLYRQQDGAPGYSAAVPASRGPTRQPRLHVLMPYH
jgi:hypothetical protein